MSEPTEAAPWFGRTSYTGHVLIVSGYQASWRIVDSSIPDGWPMINDGQGWRVDHSAHRTPYSPWRYEAPAVDAEVER